MSSSTNMGVPTISSRENTGDNVDFMKGWSDEDSGRKVEVWVELISLIAGGRGCPDTEVANYKNVGNDCGKGTKALDSTEKTIEETRKKLLIGIWTEKTGFSLEKLEQIMYIPS
ncbi:hypothetical protein AVEN_181453-1 [Araneus ventricosus]|uniref:Uncharacterized protein n=1 Tax=Araneus ventricosus TaxID=182803 RepID=A0A4Y2HVS9_ARAVE|nr:hypothetical protein AVEN_181453-1 [Araneus ventricosus]